MGPGIEVALPEWPPPQLPPLRARFAELATHVSDLPELPRMKPRQGWKLVFGNRAEAMEFDVSFSMWWDEDPAFNATFGWVPKGVVDLHGFRSADMPRTVRTLSTLACETAERLGGLIALDKSSPSSVGAPGLLYDVKYGGEHTGEHDYYADPVRFRWLARQPKFEISGWSAV